MLSRTALAAVLALLLTLLAAPVIEAQRVDISGGVGSGAGPIAITNATGASSPTTGALTVAGGLGVGGAIYGGGNIVSQTLADFVGLQVTNGTNAVASMLTSSGHDGGLLSLSFGGATKVQFNATTGGSTGTLVGLQSANGNSIVCWTSATGVLSQNTAAGCVASDERLKTAYASIAPADALDRVMRLHPVSFDWLDADQAKRDGRQIGLTAQDVRQAFPDLVTISQTPINVTLADGSTQTIEQPMAVHYDRMVAPLIAAIQAQQAEIEALKAALPPRMLKAAAPGQGRAIR